MLRPRRRLRRPAKSDLHTQVVAFQGEGGKAKVSYLSRGGTANFPARWGNLGKFSDSTVGIIIKTRQV
jgi:hypothetical protein